MDLKRQKTEQAAAAHGFVIDTRRELPQIGAVLWQMHFAKNGARLLWLERREENKTFAAAFKTLPSDDTGVFHILEHCGWSAGRRTRHLQRRSRRCRRMTQASSTYWSTRFCADPGNTR